MRVFLSIAHFCHFSHSQNVIFLFMCLCDKWMRPKWHFFSLSFSHSSLRHTLSRVIVVILSFLCFSHWINGSQSAMSHCEKRDTKRELKSGRASKDEEDKNTFYWFCLEWVNFYASFWIVFFCWSEFTSVCLFSCLWIFLCLLLL